MDSLQLMIEASEGSSKKLTDEEITGNAFVFILAGYETTATSLAFTSYLIAAHPEVQDKLHAEIDAEIGDDVGHFWANNDSQYICLIPVEQRGFGGGRWQTALFGPGLQGSLADVSSHSVALRAMG